MTWAIFYTLVSLYRRSSVVDSVFLLLLLLLLSLFFFLYPILRWLFVRFPRLASSHSHFILVSVSKMATDFPEVIELNVGGVFYTTSLKTLTSDSESHLCHLFDGKKDAPMKDAKGKYFIDRDGVLFRYILDFLRDQTLNLPQAFRERDRLIKEATYYGLSKMIDILKPQVCSPSPFSSATFLLVRKHEFNNRRYFNSPIFYLSLRVGTIIYVGIRCWILTM